MEGPAQAVFTHFYGLLQTLIQNQEQRLSEEKSTQAVILQLGHKLEQVETKVDQVEAKVEQVEAKLDKVEAKVDDLMKLQVMIF